ncbi:Triosephosphate isomerase [Komagataeibacter saccharivorans]|uniref:triose-phosphate isomerase n=1 Tax=Komagataeibacter saccharivorans TaxID=265959 RepID=UPI000D7C3FEE|nr:triose-phosphate isomerase [Komagataeibacter saccharivorans]PYD49943.1 triose-phosphate isomerase [Komagataeibacter saccharivorans]QBL93217.1 Triosephosphate isomerase [Komagataeibacter saccharivorans]GBQ35116.1 triosephosphate isomerase [Komagataeibacter saccharivorans NRIC 0614]
MKQIIVGNWKMNGLSADADALVDGLVKGLGELPTRADVVVCPPFTQLARLAPTLKRAGIALGAQDCHQDRAGAHTGDISAPMLVDLGVEYVILGHSERRGEHHELDETVREKAVAAMEAGLTPIVCVGENDDQRSAGDSQETVGWQIQGSLPQGFRGIVAYEPIWAIGSGTAASQQDIADMSAFIRAELVRQFGEAGKTIRILYGGSVNERNVTDILPVEHVDGALVGNASLKADAFVPLVRAARAS